MSFVSSLFAFLLFALALAYPGGYSLGAALLFIASLLFVWRPRTRLQRPDWILIAVLTLYTVVCLLINLLHNDPMRRYDSPLRFVLAVPPLLFLLRTPPKPLALWAGLALGSLCAGAIAIWQTTVGGLERAGGAVNPIQFGNISIALGLLCLCGLGWARTQKHARVWQTVLLTASAAGIVASFLTQSRGSWLALPLCMLVLIRTSHLHVERRSLAIFSIGVVALATVTVTIAPDSTAVRRMGLIAKEARDYLQAGNADSSVGGRMEIWRTGALIFSERPLFGVGWNGYEQRKREMVAARQADPFILVHSHAHNDFLDAMVKRGLPGLAVTLALYFFPLVAFVRMSKSFSPVQRPYALAGAITATCWIAFGLTDTFLVHNNGALLYAFMTVIFWAMARTLPKAERAEERADPVAAERCSSPA